MKRVCVYCGSSPGRLPEYLEAAKDLGSALVESGYGLVYGGASVGVMGAVANAVLSAGGEAVGVIPRPLAIREVAHDNLTALHVVESMHDRKAKMAELSDAFVALPGGWGTMEEIFEALTWAQLGLHSKPCGLLNIAGYFDHLQSFLEHSMAESFVKSEYRPMLMFDEQPARLLERFRDYEPPDVRKWITPDES